MAEIENKLVNLMKNSGIDPDLSLEILASLNSGVYDKTPKMVVKDIPGVDGRSVLDMRSISTWSAAVEQVEHSAQSLCIDPGLLNCAEVKEGRYTFTREQLSRIGRFLFQFVSYGVLNGGSATSYVDQGKNRGFSKLLFDLLRESFNNIAQEAVGRPKGLTPAFSQPNGEPGPSYMELRMRSLLIAALKHRQEFGGQHSTVPLIPMFQMTSVGNDTEVQATFTAFRQSLWLKDLIDATGWNITKVLTGIQPMIAAFTHPDIGLPYNIFSTAHGRKDSLLSLPGGHGQCFMVLKSIFRELREKGKRFVYIGNVDNLANLPEPVSLAILALSGSQGGFDFSFKTKVDVKGGILVRDHSDRLNCGDIGVAISKDEVARAEDQGKAILFNCATGLFDLEYLDSNIDTIIQKLPMRISCQDKDVGLYTQAEQITWEILGMMEKPLIFGVDKFDRFLAAKLLLENLMTSGISLNHPDYPGDLNSLAREMNNGLLRKLSTDFGLTMNNDSQVWEPVPVNDLRDL